MKPVIVFAVCILCLIACKHQPDSIDNCSDSMDVFGEDAIIDSKDFRIADHHEEWATLYNNYVHDSLEEGFVSKRYALCYIDDDSIPELCLNGMSFGEWSLILTQHAGIVSAQYCGIDPEYIEHTGLIKSSIHYLDRTLLTYIYKLQNGVFEEILSTEAKCIYHSYNPFEKWDGFIYKVNEKVVDTLYGMKYDEWSCPQLNDAYKQAYESKGVSKKYNSL